MIDLLMIFVGGLLGSGHCVGMCGPIALTVAGLRRAGSIIYADNSSTAPGESSPMPQWAP